MSNSFSPPFSRNAPCPCGSGRRYKNCCAPGASPATGARRPGYPGWERFSASEQDQLLDLMRRALAAQTDGELETADDLYRQVVLRAPETIDALHMLGVVCYQTGRLREAYANIRRALDLTDWRIHAMRANLDLVVRKALAADTHDAAGDAPAATAAIAEPVEARRRPPARAEAGHARPRVSVLVSTYNAAALLPACLEDLARQTIADATEIVVVDSGSEQDERDIVRSFESRFRNLVYVRTRRETLYAAWNRGLALAQGAFVTNANCDDAHRPDALELMATALDARPEADYAYCDYAWSSVPNDSFDAPHVTRTVVHPPYHPAQAMFYCITGCHPMWRRALFDDLGGFDGRFAAIGDYEMVLRAMAAGRRPVHVGEVLSLFYQNPQGLTFQSGRARDELVAMQARYRARMPIECLYAVDPVDPAQVAGAWTALGVLATGIDVPWLDAPHHDMGFAVSCFRRALAACGAHAPALANLAALYASTGHRDAANALLRQMPAEAAATLAQRMRDRDFVYEAATVPAAVQPLEFSPGLVPA